MSEMSLTSLITMTVQSAQTELHIMYVYANAETAHLQCTAGMHSCLWNRCCSNSGRMRSLWILTVT